MVTDTKQDTEMLTVVMMPYKKSDIVTRDYMLEFIVSAVNFFVKQSKPIKVIYYCAGIQEVLIENHDSFRSFYMDKMRVLGTAGKEIPEGAYDKLEETARKAGGAVAFFYEEDGRLTWVVRKTKNRTTWERENRRRGNECEERRNRNRKV